MYKIDTAEKKGIVHAMKGRLTLTGNATLSVHFNSVLFIDYMKIIGSKNDWARCWLEYRPWIWYCLVCTMSILGLVIEESHHLIPRNIVGSVLINHICWWKGHVSAWELGKQLAACYKGPVQSSPAPPVEAQKDKLIQWSPEGFLPQNREDSVAGMILEKFTRNSSL